MIVIVECGLGNAGSILNMLRYIGRRDVAISGDPEIVSSASKVILPGVGAFDAGMESIRLAGLRNILDKKALVEKVPVLGICLGMQLLARDSEEGKLPGLSWIRGAVVRFRFDGQHAALKVPHMGWNSVRPTPSSVLMRGYDDADPRYYFVHSYHILCDDQADVAGQTTYGYDFCSVVEHDNIMGVQFHPEKSHKFGMKLLENFASIGGAGC